MSRSATCCQHLGLEKYLQSLKLACKCSIDKYLEHARRTMDMQNVNMDMQPVRWPLLLRTIMYEQAAEVPPPSCGLTKNVCGTADMHMRSNIYFKSCGLLMKIWGCRPVVAEPHFLKKLQICNWESASFKLVAIADIQKKCACR